MVKLNDVRSSNAALVESRSLVAVFFGGTSGIGHYTLRALANVSARGGKGLRAYIVGRNARAAEDIISECRAIYSEGQYTFVKANDLSLISDVDRVCASIIQLEEIEDRDPRIDYLMLSQGGSIFLPRRGEFSKLDPALSLIVKKIQRRESMLQCR
jgi:NAD(P)-dependent dehydrogenase (short-subunit alcohol dehydrogenase family)